MELTKKEFANSLKITKLGGAVIGVLLYNRRQPIPKFKEIINKIYYNVCYYLFAIGVLGLIIDVYKAETFLAATNGAPCCFFSSLSLLKIRSLTANLEKSEKLLNDLEDLWPTGGLSQSMRKMVIEYTEKWNRVKLIFAIFNILFISTFDASAVIYLLVHYVETGELIKPLPYYIYMPFDTSGTYIYPFVFLFHVVTSSIAVLGFILSDSFFITTVTNICTQFKLLQNRIEHVVEDLKTTETISSVGNFQQHQYMVHQALIDCIRRHSELIALADIIEDIFSASVLTNFLCSSVIICCACFQSTVNYGVESVVFFLFLLTSLYQVFVLCWAGNHLIDNSCGIADAAYNSSWYLMDKKYRQLIHIIIMRSQRPQVVTAMRFSIASFQSFSSILSSAYSYFTLLTTTYNGN